ERIAALWREVLQVGRVGLDDNFFDLGGTSLLAMRVHSRLQDALEREIGIVELFQYPTVRSLGEHLAGDDPRPAPAAPASEAGAVAPAGRPAGPAEPIAIVGMAGRFPGAATLEQFWANLRGGVES